MCSAPKEREMCSLPRGASNENLQRNTLLCTQLTPRAFINSNYSVMKIRQGLHLIRKLRSPFLPLQQVFFMFGECNSCILHELKQQPSGPSGFPLLLADFISFPLLGHFCIFSLSPPQSYFYNFFLFLSLFLSLSILLYLFFLLHEPSMESHIHILPLAVQSFLFFELFFLFVSFCSSLIASPPSLLPSSIRLSQPFFSHQLHSLNQLPHPQKQWLPLCPSFRNWASYASPQMGSCSWPASSFCSSCLCITPSISPALPL